MKNWNTKQFMIKLQQIINNGGKILHRAAFPLVHVGIESDYNEQYCIENNIPLFKVERTGGTIVSNIGDFDFVFVVNPFSKKWKNHKPILLEKIVDLAREKEHTALIEKNDLLIDGYKVASYSYREVPGGVYVAMHLSMSVDISLIMNICKKPMVKVPKGLNDFGIYEEDILKIIEGLNEELV